MKIIARDSLGRDTVSEWVVEEDVLPENAKRRVATLNAAAGVSARWYYTVVPDSYVPYEWEP